MNTRAIFTTFNKTLRLFNNKKANKCTRLALVRSCTFYVGRFLKLYEFDKDMMETFDNEVLPAFLGIKDEKTLDVAFDALYILMKRVRNKLGMLS